MKDTQPLPASSIKRKQFTSRYKLPKLPVNQARRQGRISLIAWDALGREAALLFLNSHNETLGGRPLDLAMQSDDGFNVINLAIAARASAVPLHKGKGHGQGPEEIHSRNQKAQG